MLSSRGAHRGDVLLDQRVYVDLFDGALDAQDLIGIGHLFQRIDRMGELLGFHDQHLVGLAWVAQLDTQQKTVQFRFRQWERALVLDRVLRRKHDERLRQLVRHAIDGDLALPHRFQERGLGLRRRTIDLVGKHDLRDDRSLMELEVACLLVVDRNAGHVCGEQVGCELDAAEAAAGRSRQASRQNRLTYARHILDQHVASAHQRDEGETNGFRLAYDDALDVLEDALRDDLRVFQDTSTCETPCVRSPSIIAAASAA